MGVLSFQQRHPGREAGPQSLGSPLETARPPQKGAPTRSSVVANVFLEALLKSPLAVLLVALVGATACTDAVSTAPSDFKARAATTTSTAPPPPVTGVIGGSFSVSAAALTSALSSLSLDIAATATPLHHTFSQAAIYNKDLLTGVSSIQMRNHLAIWVSDAGASIGHGVITDTEQNGDIWTIDLTQIHSATGGQLLTCQSATDHGEFCVQIAQPIIATVQVFHGLDGAGLPVYDAPLHTSGSTLSFVWHII